MHRESPKSFDEKLREQFEDGNVENDVQRRAYLDKKDEFLMKNGYVLRQMISHDEYSRRYSQPNVHCERSVDPQTGAITVIYYELVPNRAITDKEYEDMLASAAVNSENMMSNQQYQNQSRNSAASYVEQLRGKSIGLLVGGIIGCIISVLFGWLLYSNEYEFLGLILGISGVLEGTMATIYYTFLPVFAEIVQNTKTSADISLYNYQKENQQNKQ